MSRYFAEVVNGEVVRVVVCDNPEWLTERLGGTWVETADPYTDIPQDVVYTGPGHGYDPDWPCRFASKWVQPVAIPVEELIEGQDPWTWYHAGAVVWHNGHLWVSTLNQNVWEPGTSGWRRTPTRPGVPPLWTQPTGAHDVWNLGEHVMHGDVEYESQIDANTTVPGSDDRWWRPVGDEPAGPQPWVQPSGAHDAYAQGDVVHHNGQDWTSDLNGNVWEPGVYGWTPNG